MLLAKTAEIIPFMWRTVLFWRLKLSLEVSIVLFFFNQCICEVSGRASIESRCCPA